MLKCREWRERHAREAFVFKQLEGVAIEQGLEEFEPSDPYHLRIHMWGPTMEEFVAKVKEVSEKLGPPDETTPSEVNVGSAPDLVAQWEMDREIDKGEGRGPAQVKVTVRANWPKDCKIDPRVKPAPPVYSRIHPECAAVLKELED